MTHRQSPSPSTTPFVSLADGRIRDSESALRSRPTSLAPPSINVFFQPKRFSTTWLTVSPNPAILNHMVENHERTLDNVFHALSDQTRRAILARLAANECSVGELAEPFDMSLAAVSKHIKVLEDAGLIEKIKEGRTYRCRPSFDRLNDANALLEQLAGFWQGRLDALDAFLAGESPQQGHEHGERTGATHPKAGGQKGSPRKKRKSI